MAVYTLEQRFAKWVCDRLTGVADFCKKKIIFSDEAHFDLIFFENEQGEVATVNGDRYQAMLNEFLFTNIELATYGFNRTALRATQTKLQSMFCALFLKIGLSAAELMSFGQLGAAT